MLLLKFCTLVVVQGGEDTGYVPKPYQHTTVMLASVAKQLRNTINHSEALYRSPLNKSKCIKPPPHYTKQFLTLLSVAFCLALLVQLSAYANSQILAYSIGSKIGKLNCGCLLKSRS